MFPGGETLMEAAEHIPSALTPEPYKQMLVHDQHMTVTMEKYHDCTVDVKIIDRCSEGDVYCRKILLLKTGTDQVVQFGLVRFHFEYVTSQVRDEILAGEIPLGRVLINHNVLRHIDLGAILRVTPGEGLCGYFGMSPGEVTYGRMATIFCNHQPAVDLLEISAPLTTTETST
jgi:chorismate-pyruvate lyase